MEGDQARGIRDTLILAADDVMKLESRCRGGPLPDHSPRRPAKPEEENEEMITPNRLKTYTTLAATPWMAARAARVRRRKAIRFCSRRLLLAY